MLRQVITLIFLSLITSSYAFSEDVINTKSYQQGNRLVIVFDLVGDSPVNLLFSIVVQGKSYPAERLHLEGDFGKDIRPGTGKNIIWNTLQDFPRGVRGQVRWSLYVENKRGSFSSGTSLFSSSESGSDVITTEKGVSFKHKAHAEALKDCKKCHEKAEGGKIDGFGKDLAHKKACKDCHIEMRKGPTNCRGCHV